MITGKCLCGKVRYEINGRLGPVVYCHCSMCRRATGSAFVTNASVRANEFRVVAGSETDFGVRILSVEYTHILLTLRLSALLQMVRTRSTSGKVGQHSIRVGTGAGDARLTYLPRQKMMPPIQVFD
jgi:hypothetical protein